MGFTPTIIDVIAKCSRIFAMHQLVGKKNASMLAMPSLNCGAEG